MNYDKIKDVLLTLHTLNDKIGLKYKVVIVKDSYFFFVDKGFVDKYYEKGHKNIRGRYTGILSFTKEDSKNFNIFISEILYNHVDSKIIFQKILYQILIYQNPDLFKFKYKKLKKRLQRYLSTILPKTMTIDSTFVDNMQSSKEDSFLFEKAKIIIPHMSLFNLMEKLSQSKEEVHYVKNIGSYLKPSEYMIPDHEEHSHHHD